MGWLTDSVDFKALGEWKWVIVTTEAWTQIPSSLYHRPC